MPPTISIFELCVRRAALVEPRPLRAAQLGGKVAAFVDEWARMMRETGNEAPTLVEWTVWACVPSRTADRRLHEFRAMFAEWHDTPTVLARHVNRAVALRRGSVVPSGLVPAL